MRCGAARWSEHGCRFYQKKTSDSVLVAFVCRYPSARHPPDWILGVFTCVEQSQMPFLTLSTLTLTRRRRFCSPSLQRWAPGSTDGCPVPQRPGRTSDAPSGWWPRTGAPLHHPAGGERKVRTCGQSTSFRLCKCFPCMCCAPSTRQTTIKLRTLSDFSRRRGAFVGDGKTSIRSGQPTNEHLYLSGSRGLGFLARTCSY